MHYKKNIVFIFSTLTKEMLERHWGSESPPLSIQVCGTSMLVQLLMGTEQKPASSKKEAKLARFEKENSAV